MRRNLIETILGGVVLVVAAIFMIFAYSNADLRQIQGNDYVARFNRIDGVNPGGDVRMSGIKVGTVRSVAIDPKTFVAVVHLTVDRNVALPADTSAEVASDGLLGGKYLSLVPGGDEKTIQPGGEIRYTQGPINLEQMIGQLIFSNQAGNKDKQDDSGEKGAAPGDKAPGDKPEGDKPAPRAPTGPTL
ncbi:MAG TPA: outer membrane lipid asymmetry maintenance protein MlaD [Alphaproteobacteria bacterium]|jgi:phospholipid/cholesterol/gamma-HCH transport system substrate-binding protein|nr:outer membrane lipid asymmetry maintenance protein MlaD [Alphaproteobacteria bacterium]